MSTDYICTKLTQIAFYESYWNYLSGQCQEFDQEKKFLGRLWDSLFGQVKSIEKHCFFCLFVCCYSKGRQIQNYICCIKEK